MYLRRLEIYNLRNIVSIDFELNPGLSIIVGNNGQGKTSILEAIFLLSHARSFRTSSLKEVVNHKASESSFIKGTVEGLLGTFEIHISIVNGKRVLSVNQKNINNTADFCGLLKTVLFTPEDLELVKGGPVIRRQFIDRVLVMLEPSLIKDLTEYARLVKTRNRLLIEGDTDRARLFDNNLIEKNLTIAEKRNSVILKIKGRAAEFYDQISQINDETIDLSYRSSFTNSADKIISREEARKIFTDAISKDVLHKRTNVGIHRDEILIKFSSPFAKGSSRVISSQGQVRLISLCCKLASADLIKEYTGEHPLLLLDDVDAELDRVRAKRLYSILAKYPGQILLTGTEFPNDMNESINENINLSTFKVDSGVLLKADNNC